MVVFEGTFIEDRPEAVAKNGTVNPPAGLKPVAKHDRKYVCVMGEWCLVTVNWGYIKCWTNLSSAL